VEAKLVYPTVVDPDHPAAALALLNEWDNFDPPSLPLLLDLKFFLLLTLSEGIILFPRSFLVF
jgi:hypothetical protein